MRRSRPCVAVPPEFANDIGKKVASALISEHGRSSERPINIITPRDFVTPGNDNWIAASLFTTFGLKGFARSSAPSSSPSEDRPKAEVIEIGLEKRSACVFEVQGVGPKDEPQGHQCRPSSPHTPTGKAGRLLTSWPCWPSTKLATPVGLPFAGAGRCCRRHSAGRHNPASTRN